MSGKLFIKNLLSKLHTHRKRLPDVFIYTLPRSGSTLLLEVLNTDRRYKAVSEPLVINAQNIRILKKYLPKEIIAERYTDLSGAHFENLMHYFNLLSLGKLPTGYYWTDLFEKSHAFRTKGSLFKTHKITHLFAKVAEYTAAVGIYLLRHPAAVSLSRMKLNTDHYIETFLKTESVQAHISDTARSAAKAIAREGSRFEQFVCSWCLENFEFFRLLKTNALPPKVFFLSFEELILQPATLMPKLCERTGLQFSNTMLQTVNKPSHGTVHSTKETIAQITKGENSQILRKWQQTVSPEETKQLYEILQLFDIDYYSENQILPTKKSNAFTP